MEEHGIPGASIGSVDLEQVAKTDPTAAAEIARINNLMQQGKESKEEFLTLVQLMYRAGYHQDAEYLLRCNVDSAEDEALYRMLFGSKMPDEFDRAILALAAEFSLVFHLRAKETDFLHAAYESVSSDQTTPRYNVLHGACVIRFAYNRQNYVIAEVMTAEAEQEGTIDEYDLTKGIYLRWQQNEWHLIDWRDSE